MTGTVQARHGAVEGAAALTEVLKARCFFLVVRGPFVCVCVYILRYLYIYIYTGEYIDI